MDNYIQLRSFSPFHYRFMFVDTREYVSAGIFADLDLRLWRIRELIKKESPFRLIVCSIRKRDIAKFTWGMTILRNRTVFLGYCDYDNVCEELKVAEAALKNG